MLHVLIVDDESAYCKNIQKLLSVKGCMTFEAHNGQEALALLKKKRADIVLLDIRMPVMGGIETLKQIKKDYPDIEVIMVTAISEIDDVVECLKNGAYGYVTKPINIETVLIEIEKALEHKRLAKENRDFQKNLEQMVGREAAKIQSLYQKLERNLYDAVNIFIELLELHDPFLGGHLRRVATLAMQVGKKVGLHSEKLKDLEIAGLLHDLGSLGIQVNLQNKPYNELNEAEKKLIESQTVLTQEILSPIEKLRNAGSIIRSHLEHVDGSGFPDSLKGESISLESKILGAANAYDEVMNRRRFSSSMPDQNDSREDLAISHLMKGVGNKFDQEAVEIIEKVLKEKKTEQRETSNIPPQDLKEGMILAEDLLTDDGELLLSCDSSLNSAHIYRVSHYHSLIKPFNKEIKIYK